MTTQRLFGRAMRLTMGTRRISMVADPSSAGSSVTATTLRAQFKVTKNLKAEPNTASVKVWNLSRDTRSILESPKTVPVLLEVGYGSDLHAIFNGQMRSAQHERDSSAIITTLATGDGETAIGGGRAFSQVPAKATPSQILAFAAQGLRDAGIGAGNLASAQDLATASFGGPARTLHGNAARVMTEVCTANEFEWSIQDGNLQILKIGASVKEQAGAVRLSGASGMVGSPSVDTKGILKAKALIQPGLFPGLPVVIDGEFVKGTYRIEEVEFSGDTWDTDWYASITGRKW